MKDYNDSLPLRVNSTSPFTLSYALWPFICLISLIATVWLLVYILTICSRRHNSKSSHRNFASLYVTRDETNAGGYEFSAVISPLDV